MSKTFYTLDIDTKPELFEWLEGLLGVKRNPNKNFWAHDITYADKRPPMTAPTVIGHYLNLLESKYELLKQHGIKSSDITIWMVYEYNNECNMEFHPEDTKRLGDNGIILCVSCYQTSEE
ncbi:hypothetical protein [Dyadobacter aurulentus]|uniref:hypothetical protein n=1 Tax=Dyadobacter sp. UC 10 TaxID=2605428 RepID=UPI0011F1B8C8|nr:hypothetical protein [Dyadobacter sp. UC 10]KAA0991682.1 hypothetical protein FXO21_16640 [Dyadobacter sp. UC 10]